MERTILITKQSKDYELLDSGDEEKLERYGKFVLARPDPQALWNKKRGDDEWRQAQGRYARKGREGKWDAKGLPKSWQIGFGGLELQIRATSFKHTGLFPEQLGSWEWVGDMLRKNHSAPKVLNLFAYTGGATLVAALAGAQVTHVDASAAAVSWARENAKLSKLEDAPIRWITEDVLTFVKREIKRGNTYDAIIMDPPAFGHGPKKELWKIEEDLLKLFELCEQLLSPEPLFVLVSGYAAGYSPLMLAYNLERFEKKFGGSITYGDLTIEASSLRQGSAGQARLLPCGIFGRWAKSTGDTVDSQPLFR